MLTISGRAAGSRRPLFSDWSIPLPPGDPGEGGLTLRDLIERVVRAEVRAYEERRQARRLDRVLSRGAIDAGAEAGKVSPEGKETPAAPDPEEAVGAALEAFEDGLYLVIIDGTEHRDLEAQVFLRDDSRVTFVKLMFLSGGF